MRYASLTLIVALLLGGAALLAAPVPAGASSHGAVTVRQAQRAYVKAERAAAEARRVWLATANFTRLHGAAVGRWTALSRRAGFHWGELPELMHVIARESGGNPRAKNPTSTASGLLQFLSFWWAGRWDPFDPYQNLLHGARAVHSVGWQPWAL